MNKPVWAVTHALRRCGVPCAEQIAAMLAKCGGASDVPNTPTASMYLYGQQSDSGNIGLRVGDTVTYYSGHISPMWDRTKYPFGVALYNQGESYRVYHFYAFAEQHYYETTHVLTSRYFGTSSDPEIGGPACVAWIKYGIDGEWEASEGVANVQTDMGSVKVNSQNELWTSFDMYYKDGTLKSAASDPIPVGEIVEYIDGIPIYEVIT